MKREQCRRPERHGDLFEAGRTKEQRPEAEQDAVARRQIRSALSGSGEDEELLLDEQFLGDARLGAAWAEEPSNGSQKVDEDYREVLHRLQTRTLRRSEQDCQIADFSPV